MKKTAKIIAMCAALCVGALATFSSPRAGFTYAGDMSGGEMSPQSLYVQNCARCHGKDGKSDTPTGRRLKADDLNGVSASKAARIIASGKGKMPSFKRKLTAAQISQIAGYVSTL
jgi:mono/diheme cytochrome c family protein